MLLLLNLKCFRQIFVPQSVNGRAVNWPSRTVDFRFRFLGQPSEMAQTGQLKTKKKKHSFTVLEARSLKARWWQSCASSSGFREDSSLASSRFRVIGVPWLVATSLHLYACPLLCLPENSSCLSLMKIHAIAFRTQQVPSLQGKQMGKQWKQWQTLFFRDSKSLQMVTAAMKLKDTYSLEGKLWPT